MLEATGQKWGISSIINHMCISCWTGLRAHCTLSHDDAVGRLVGRPVVLESPFDVIGSLLLPRFLREMLLHVAPQLAVQVFCKPSAANSCTGRNRGAYHPLTYSGIHDNRRSAEGAVLLSSSLHLHHAPEAEEVLAL